MTIIIFLLLIVNITIGTILCTLSVIINKDFSEFLNKLSFTQSVFLFLLGPLSLLAIPYAIVKSEGYVIKNSKFKLGDKVKIKNPSLEDYYSRRNSIYKERNLFVINSIRLSNGKLIYTAYDGDTRVCLGEKDVEKALSRKERIKRLY